MNIRPSKEEMCQKMVRIVSAAVGRPISEIEIDAPFSKYGMDSLAFVTLSSELEDWLGIEIEPTLGWDYPTIEKMAEYLAAEVETQT